MSVCHCLLWLAAALLVACGPEDSASSDNRPGDGAGDTGAEPPAAFPVCGEVEFAGRVTASEVRETSGLAWSRTQPILWLHNDSGDAARFFGLDSTGALRAMVDLRGATATDWEDMAAGPLPGGGQALFLGDIGDNLGLRPGIRVYRVPEPHVGTRVSVLDTLVQDYDVLELSYPDGPHNAEALFVDPNTGEVYILTKAGDGRSSLYRTPWPAGDARMRLTHVLDMHFGTGALEGSADATAADLSADGTRAVVRTYNRVFMFVGTGTSPAELLASRPQAMPVPWVRFGEAIALTPDGTSYYLLSEGTDQALNRVRCR